MRRRRRAELFQAVDAPFHDVSLPIGRCVKNFRAPFVGTPCNRHADPDLMAYLSPSSSVVCAAAESARRFAVPVCLTIAAGGATPGRRLRTRKVYPPMQPSARTFTAKPIPEPGRLVGVRFPLWVRQTVQPDRLPTPAMDSFFAGPSRLLNVGLGRGRRVGQDVANHLGSRAGRRHH